MAFHERDVGNGKGLLSTVQELASEIGIPESFRHNTCLLTQPRTLGFVFNPVSFWFFRDKHGQLRAVVAEVSNTVGQRHSYLVHHADFAPIKRDDRLQASKVFYVSPFQEIAGSYEFRFSLDKTTAGIWIDHVNGAEGVYATQTGTIRSMTASGILWRVLRFPFGALGGYVLIHWQALKLKLKGARFAHAPKPPAQRYTR